MTNRFLSLLQESLLLIYLMYHLTHVQIPKCHYRSSETPGKTEGNCSPLLRLHCTLRDNTGRRVMDDVLTTTSHLESLMVSSAITTILKIIQQRFFYTGSDHFSNVLVNIPLQLVSSKRFPLKMKLSVMMNLFLPAWLMTLQACVNIVCFNGFLYATEAS